MRHRPSPVSLLLAAGAALALATAAACGGDEGAPPASGPDDFVVYTHALPDGATDLATGDFYTPALSHPPIPVDPRYRHVLCFQMVAWLVPIREAIPSSGPLVLFSDDLDVLVFSPMDHFFLSLVDFRDGAIHYGVQGDVASLPPGFEQRFVLVEGKGLNATLERWGEILRADRGLARRDPYADTGLATLGYWTDNGAAYFYQTAPGLNEEETLLAVEEEANALGIPYGYFQIDS